MGGGGRRGGGGAWEGEGLGLTLKAVWPGVIWRIITWTNIGTAGP